MTSEEWQFRPGALFRSSFQSTTTMSRKLNALELRLHQAALSDSGKVNKSKVMLQISDMRIPNDRL